MFPYSLVSYMGILELKVKSPSKFKAKKKLKQLLRIEYVGRYNSEGLGKIKWLEGEIKKWTRQKNPASNARHLRIRKGLPHNLSKNAQKLIQYSLLHDFFHTSTHPSKIYVEPKIANKEFRELLKQHHEKIDHPLVKEFQHFDHLSAMITRKIRSPINSRYNWRATKKINFEKLANQIKEVSNNVWKLYEFIYNSKELDLLNESLEHGHSSLRNHLLVIANLIVQNLKFNRI